VTSSLGLYSCHDAFLGIRFLGPQWTAWREVGGQYAETKATKKSCSNTGTAVRTTSLEEDIG
jgi:hypothetical protein